MLTPDAIPLTLYIHFPWCVKKCPYCDFNSHALRGDLAEEAYINALIEDLAKQALLANERSIEAIFLGGGTPSLFSAKALERLFQAIRTKLTLIPDCEITLEANPGTIERGQFRDYFAIGINRISLGVQSFDSQQLKRLGRIHSSNETHQAIDEIRAAGFKRFNIDIMYALPNQSVAEAVADVAQAINCQPTHISWYQLTLEPNTLFYVKPPELPNEDTVLAIESAGRERLVAAGFVQYEVSAFGQGGHRALHNLNYWQFGDYLGIGAGAHSKLTLCDGRIIRQLCHKHPKAYLAAKDKVMQTRELDLKARQFEYMLNHLRLSRPVSQADFEAKTGLAFEVLGPALKKAVEQELIVLTTEGFNVTEHGRRFHNNLVELFL